MTDVWATGSRRRRQESLRGNGRQEGRKASLVGSASWQGVLWWSCTSKVRVTWKSCLRTCTVLRVLYLLYEYLCLCSCSYCARTVSTSPLRGKAKREQEDRCGSIVRLHRRGTPPVKRSQLVFHYCRWYKIVYKKSILTQH